MKIAPNMSIYTMPESSDPKYTEKTLEILKRHPEWSRFARTRVIMQNPQNKLHRKVLP